MAGPPFPLCSLLVPALPEALRAEEPAPELLEPVLEALVQDARAAYPKVSLHVEVFLPYLAERLPIGDSLLQSLRRVLAPELYLACACARGHAQAIAAFDTIFVQARGIDIALGRLSLSAAMIQDVKQTLMTRLLVTLDDAPPKITQYTGDSSLKAWVRVVAVREALRMLHKTRKEVTAEGPALSLDIAHLADPEHDYLKQRYRAQLQRAFQEALGRLSARERNLLRQHYLYRLSLEQIGTLYGVHRATAARWLVRLREELVCSARQHLVDHVGMAPADFDSILRLVQSQLDLGMQDLLDRTDSSDD